MSQWKQRPDGAYETTIGWHRIGWQMIRHLCGPARAVDHEIGRRYAREMGWHLSPEARAARIRRMVDEETS